MKKFSGQKLWFCLIACLFLSVALWGCGIQKNAQMQGGGYDVTDIQGTVVHMDGKPQRILTLSMSTDEIIAGLVEPERIAAVNHLLDDPVSSNISKLVTKIPARIGNPSVEEIVSLHPDLVIVPDWGNLERVGALRDLGLKVVVCQGPKSIMEIKDTIALLAAAVGENRRGEVLLKKMADKQQEIKEKVDRIPVEKRKTVVLLSLMGAYGGSGCAFDDACQNAGVINGMAKAGIKTGQTMSKEQLIAINPDILFLPTYNNHGNFDIEAFRNSYVQDPSLQTMKAIEQKQLVSPREGYIYNCSQDIVYGIQEIAYCAYGEEFKQVPDCHLSAVDD